MNPFFRRKTLLLPALFVLTEEEILDDRRFGWDNLPMKSSSSSSCLRRFSERRSGGEWAVDDVVVFGNGCPSTVGGSDLGFEGTGNFEGRDKGCGVIEVSMVSSISSSG